METIIFYMLAAGIVVFSVLTVTTRLILRAAVYLLFTLLFTAGIYLMLNYQFLAAVQLTVYAGGIVILIVFSVLLTSHINDRLELESSGRRIAAAMVSLVGIILTTATIANANFTPVKTSALPIDTKTIGYALMSYGNNGYILPFEVISILLLAAMIGAIVIAKKR
jgi:NADH-quinone oxidoreductase subunit J